MTFDMGGGVKQTVFAIAPLHKGAGPFTQADEIDTAWQVNTVPGQAQYQRMQITGDYHVFAGSNPAFEFDAGAVVKFVHADSAEEVAFTAQQLQWNNDLNQISPIATPTKAVGSVSDYQINFPAAFGTDLDFRWYSTATALRKELIVQNLAALGSPPQFIIDGGNPVVRLQFVFTASANVDIWINGGVWNRNQRNITTSQIEFRDGTTGDLRWIFFAPYAKDNDQETVPGEMELQRQGQSLFVRVRIPWAWLETAAYPVTIDPPVSYWAGAGDGSVSLSTGGNVATTWVAVHDSATGSDAAPTGVSIYLCGARATPTLFIYRGFFPVSTSGIGTDNISAASMWIAPRSITNDSPTTNAWVSILQGFQADPTTLTTADYDTAGDATDNPTEGSDRVALGAFVQDNYSEWVLDATGIGWINKTGWTQLATRIGHDQLDVPIDEGQNSRSFCNYSETSGTALDPYLEVTHAAAASTRRIFITHT